MTEMELFHRLQAECREVRNKETAIGLIIQSLPEGQLRDDLTRAATRLSQGREGIELILRMLETT